MLRKLVLLLALLFAGPVAADSGPYPKRDNVSRMTAEELHGACNSPDDSMWRACISYIMGVVDADVVAMANGYTPPAWHYCLPSAGDGFQLIAVVKKWLADNPERLHYVAPITITMAMIEAFPCP
ncbi:MAG: Rap1a/Tai family immunity protein [Pseudomonadota bacterium]